MLQWKNILLGYFLAISIVGSIKSELVVKTTSTFSSATSLSMYLATSGTDSMKVVLSQGKIFQHNSWLDHVQQSNRSP
ncbi:MAG: hypothetical protein QXR44_05980, partial [Thermoproteota archaeon]